MGQNLFIVLIWWPRRGKLTNCVIEFNQGRQLVNMDHCSAVHRVFAVETFLKNSVIPTQQIFRRHINIGRHETVPHRNTLKKWVQKFRTTASATNKKPENRVRTVRTPETIERARAAVGRSPKRSACRHSVALNVSSRPLWRILHSGLLFRPYQLHILR